MLYYITIRKYLLKNMYFSNQSRPPQDYKISIIENIIRLLQSISPIGFLPTNARDTYKINLLSVLTLNWSSTGTKQEFASGPKKEAFENRFWPGLKHDGC